MPYPGTNGLAVSAVAVGLVGIVPPLVLPMLETGPMLLLPLVGMVFGIVALAQLRRHPQRGRGMAITGIVLGAGVLVLLALGISALVGGSPESGGPHPPRGPRTPIESLEPGDCYNGLDDSTGAGVTPRPCTAQHEAQVVTRVTLPEGAYPGPERVREMVRDACGQPLIPLLDERFIEELETLAIYPESALTWSYDRSVTCIVAPFDRAIDTSVLK